MHAGHCWILCFPFWQSYFIKIFEAGLQCEFIRTFLWRFFWQGNFYFLYSCWIWPFVRALQVAAKLDRVVVLRMLHTWDFVGPQAQQFYYCICSLFWPRLYPVVQDSNGIFLWAKERLDWYKGNWLGTF